MDVFGVELIKLQPIYLQNDKMTIALCTAFEPVFALLAESAKAQLIYTNIKNLDSHSLYLIANGMGCSWFDGRDSLEEQRETVSNALKIFARRGTPSALKDALSANFGHTELQEWFDYGGMPGHFRIIIEDETATVERAWRFLKIVEEVKNARSKLDEIILQTVARTTVNMVVVARITETIRSVEHG